MRHIRRRSAPRRLAVRPLQPAFRTDHRLFDKCPGMIPAETSVRNGTIFRSQTRERTVGRLPKSWADVLLARRKSSQPPPGRPKRFLVSCQAATMRRDCRSEMTWSPPTAAPAGGTPEIPRFRQTGGPAKRVLTPFFSMSLRMAVVGAGFLGLPAATRRR